MKGGGEILLVKSKVGEFNSYLIINYFVFYVKEFKVYLKGIW